MTTPVNINQLFLPTALQLGPGGEMIVFDAGGNPTVIDSNAPGSISINSQNVTYDNTTSGLTATELQAAIDELDSIIDGLGAGTTTFTGLTDTPASFAGQALQVLRVNAGETGVEFTTPSSAFDISSLPAGTPASTDLLVFSDVDDANTQKNATVADVVNTLGLVSFDIDALPPVGTVNAADELPITVAGIESRITFANFEAALTPAPFDVDALPAITTLLSGDQILVSTGGTESKMSASDFRDELEALPLAPITTGPVIGYNDPERKTNPRPSWPPITSHQIVVNYDIVSGRLQYHMWETGSNVQYRSSRAYIYVNDVLQIIQSTGSTNNVVNEYTFSALSAGDVIKIILRPGNYHQAAYISCHIDNLKIFHDRVVPGLYTKII